MKKEVEYYIGKIVDKEDTKKNIFRNYFSILEKMDEDKYKDIDTSEVLTNILEKEESGVTDLILIYKGPYYSEVENEIKLQVNSMNKHIELNEKSKKKKLSLKYYHE